MTLTFVEKLETLQECKQIGLKPSINKTKGRCVKMETVKEFLKENSLKKLQSKSSYKMPFKKYLPLDKGNSKLYKNILSFSLLPVVTCDSWCKGCYDIRSLRHATVREKRRFNTWLAVNDRENLKAQIIKQIKNSKSAEFVRIHVGGDFFSIDYVNMWAEIKMWADENKPNVIFYTYTKTEHISALKSLEINVVDSILPNGSMNFDKLENLQAFRKKNKGYTICPATMKKKNVICGKTCNLCMAKSKVLFVKH